MGGPRDNRLRGSGYDHYPGGMPVYSCGLRRMDYARSSRNILDVYHSVWVSLFRDFRVLLSSLSVLYIFRG